MSSEFWAAIAGALVGGFIAAVLQWLGLRASAKERAKNTLENDRAEARALLFKVIKIQSDFQSIAQIFGQMQANAKQHRMPFDWQTCIPLANLPREIEFSASEMSVLLKTKDNDLFNDVVSLDHVHSGIIQNLDLYRIKRGRLTDSLPAEMEGTIGTTRGDETMRRYVEPKAAELNMLLDQLIASIVDAYDAEMKLTARLTEALNRAYSLGVSTQVRPNAGANLDV